MKSVWTKILFLRKKIDDRIFIVEQKTLTVTLDELLHG